MDYADLEPYHRVVASNAPLTDGTRARSASALAALGWVLAGCAFSPVAVDGRDVAVGMGMGCEQAAEFAFAGQASLAQLGLADDFGGGPDTQRVGTVVVTADPVDMGAPPGQAAPMERMVCVQWPDGSGMGGTVPRDWQPPGGLRGSAAESEGSGPPLVLIGLVAAAAVILGVSFLAFRSEPSRP